MSVLEWMQTIDGFVFLQNKNAANIFEVTVAAKDAAMQERFRLIRAAIYKSAQNGKFYHDFFKEAFPIECEKWLELHGFSVKSKDEKFVTVGWLQKE